MFQDEIHNLKSGKVFYRHIFVDKHYQITITRAAITREQLRDYLHIFLVLRRQNKVHVDKIVNDKGVFYTVKIFN
jgi:hypothetical protein